MNTAPTYPPVAIIGGGFSGAAVAWHLLRLRPEIQRIVVVEPRKELGRGLAYDASDPSWRVNVPAARMSLIPDLPNHFNDWLLASGHLDADAAARMADGRSFPARAIFGAYVNEHIHRLGARIDHAVTIAKAVSRTSDGYEISCVNGRRIFAKIVILAVCHPPPIVPALLKSALAGHPRLVTNPWSEGALEVIRPEHRVLIVGSGLTMADIVASLDLRGHRGSVVAVSRRGLRSRGHPATPCEPYGDFATRPARTVRELVQGIRSAIAEAAREGKGWHGVLDQVRLQGEIIWRALPIIERRRLLRHIRPFWDVHRFRIAPQVERVLDQRIAEGTLTLWTASLRGAAVVDEQIEVTLRDRRSGDAKTLRFDAVVTATGPAHGRLFTDDALLGALHAAELARPDPLFLGVDVDHKGRAIGGDGRANDDIFVAGPIARATFGELMGLPEVTNHAVRVATGVAERLASIG